MPRAYDRQQLIVDRNPLDGLVPELSQLPKLELPALLAFDQLWNNFVRTVLDMTGLNFASIEGFFNSIIGQIQQFFASIGLPGGGDGFTIDPNDFLQTLLNGLHLGTGINLTGPETLLESTGIGSSLDALLADITETWNAWLSALTGRPQQEATPALTAEQIAELMATTVANSSALAALQSAVQGGLTNMIASGDDFERAELNPTGKPPMWAFDYSAAPASNGEYVLASGEMVWRDKGNMANRARFRRINPSDAKTFTPYQRVTRVTGRSVAEPSIIILGLGVAAAEDHLYARVSDDFSKYLVLQYDGDGTVVLRYNVGAGERDFNPPAVARVAKPTAGTTYALECGDAGDLRSFRVLRNNSTVLAYEDTAGVTAQLDTLTGWGWGGRAVPRGGGQGTPSSVHSVTVTDIPPEPTIGSFLHVVRDTATAITKPGGEVLLPAGTGSFGVNKPTAGTFNNILRNSPDVTFDNKFGTQTILIAKPGPYKLVCRITTESSVNNGDEWELLFYRITGSTVADRRLLFRSAQVGSPGAALGANPVNSIEAVFQFYSQGINQQYALGFNSNDSEKIIGNANGDCTWLTITRGV